MKREEEEVRKGTRGEEDAGRRKEGREGREGLSSSSLQVTKKVSGATSFL